MRNQTAKSPGTSLFVQWDQHVRDQQVRLVLVSTIVKAERLFRYGWLETSCLG